RDPPMTAGAKPAVIKTGSVDGYAEDRGGSIATTFKQRDHGVHRFAARRGIEVAAIVVGLVATGSIIVLGHEVRAVAVVRDADGPIDVGREVRDRIAHFYTSGIRGTSV